MGAGGALFVDQSANVTLTDFTHHQVIGERAARPQGRGGEGAVLEDIVVLDHGAADRRDVDAPLRQT
jgi:hypothetical protein